METIKSEDLILKVLKQDKNLTYQKVNLNFDDYECWIFEGSTLCYYVKDLDLILKADCSQNDENFTFFISEDEEVYWHYLKNWIHYDVVLLKIEIKEEPYYEI